MGEVQNHEFYSIPSFRQSLTMCRCDTKRVKPNASPFAPRSIGAGWLRPTKKYTAKGSRESSFGNESSLGKRKRKHATTTAGNNVKTTAGNSAETTAGNSVRTFGLCKIL